MSSAASGNSLFSLRFVAGTGALIIKQLVPLRFFLQSYDPTDC